jgi:hypothetical protein
MSESKRAVVVVVLLVVSVVAAAGTASSSPDREEHCVVEVLDQLESGEFVISDPVCFETFAEAAFAASLGTVRLDPGVTPDGLATAPGVVALSTFTLGVHYDGYSGSGSSITVVGSNCNGGYWNTTTAWDNRISSTWNGCNRINHHDLPNKGGDSRSTYGAGSVHNVPYPLDNAAESVSYSSS